jgi:hypothetical protein
LKKVLS